MYLGKKITFRKSFDRSHKFFLIKKTRTKNTLVLEEIKLIDYFKTMFAYKRSDGQAADNTAIN